MISLFQRDFTSKSILSRSILPTLVIWPTGIDGVHVDKKGYLMVDPIGGGQETDLPVIFVDADACPVKNEVCRVAERHGLSVKFVANTGMGVPEVPRVEMIVVGNGFDEADDWIVDHVSARDIVVTEDIPLAARCLAKGVHVLSSKGREFTEASIGGALANRNFLSQLREHGLVTGGPAPFEKKDRSQFLQRLENLVCACRNQK